MATNTYHSEDNVVQLKDAEGRITSYTYDALNRRTQVKDALIDTTSFTYDAVGNLRNITDENGRFTRRTYDALNRVINETSPTRTNPTADSVSRTSPPQVFALPAPWDRATTMGNHAIQIGPTFRQYGVASERSDKWEHCIWGCLMYRRPWMPGYTPGTISLALPHDYGAQLGPLAIWFYGWLKEQNDANDGNPRTQNEAADHKATTDGGYNCGEVSGNCHWEWSWNPWGLRWVCTWTQSCAQCCAKYYR